jgi:chemotaxis protein histidine kinase CheA
LETVHSGGKRMVPNPNPNPLARDRHPKVTFNSALKNKDFFKHALKAYQEWAKKNPSKEDEGKKRPKAPEEEERKRPAAPEEERGKPAAPPEEEKPELPPEEEKPAAPKDYQPPKEKKKPAPSAEPLPTDKEQLKKVIKKEVQKAVKEETEKAVKEEPEKGAPEGEKAAPKFDVKGHMSLSDEDIDAVAQTHKEHFDRLTNDIKQEVAKYDESVKDDPIMNKYFSGLSEPEKMIHVGGHLIGRYFEDSVLKGKQKNYHERVLDSWQRASSGYYLCHYLHGALSSMGVSGSLSPRDRKDEKVDPRLKARGVLPISKARKKGAGDKETLAYLKDVYAFQQAYFRHIGLKELTVYRGVRGQGIDEDPPKIGTSVKFETRELSSFSTDPKRADEFGRTTRFKIPVERVWASSCVRPNFGADPKTAFEKPEHEVMVMGASDLDGEILSKAEGLE